MLPTFTTMIGLDTGHIEQFNAVWPTWDKHRPQLLDKLLVLADAASLTRRCGENFAIAVPEKSQVEWWGWCPRVAQRERMFTGFVHTAAGVATDYVCKIDVDVIALPPDGKLFPNPEWFIDRPAVVSSPWGYSKPADTVERLDEWADRLPQFDGTQPLGHRAEPGAETVKHSRTAGWLAFYRTDFCRRVYDAVMSGNPDGRMPVPSCDSIWDYCARRWGETIVTPRMSRWGFQTISGTRRLKEAAAESLKD